MANCKEHGPAYTGRPTAYVRTVAAFVVVVIYLPVCRDTVSPADPESLQTVNLVLCMFFLFLNLPPRLDPCSAGAVPGQFPEV